jgi:hypothetical protein
MREHEVFPMTELRRRTFAFPAGFGQFATPTASGLLASREAHPRARELPRKVTPHYRNVARHDH